MKMIQDEIYYGALDVSKYIVTSCRHNHQSFTNMNLQKVLFAIQREWLRRFNEPLFDDPIEAWQFGPVVRDVYYYFCGNGAMPIIATFDYSKEIVSNKNHKIIDEIADKYITIEPWDMYDDICAPRGAWDRTFNNGRGNKNIIMLKDIKKYG